MEDKGSESLQLSRKLEQAKIEAERKDKLLITKTAQIDVNLYRATISQSHVNYYCLLGFDEEFNQRIE